MGGFWFPGKKRTATAQKRQVKPTSPVLQSETFILERILTPSGLVDGGDDALHPLVTDLHVPSVPDVNLSDTNYWDADLTHATEVSENQAFLDSRNVEITDKQIFAEHVVEVPIADHDLEPLPFIYNLDTTTEDAVTDSFIPVTDKSILATNLASEQSTSTLDIGGTKVSDVGVTDKQIFADHSGDATVPDSKVEPISVSQISDTTTEDAVTSDSENSIFVTNLEPQKQTFTSGVWTVDSTGKVSIDYLFDGGKYQGQVAIFSLDGMDKFVPGSEEFIHEATSRALSDSNLGHVVINDVTQGARFHGTLPWEPDYNSGEYQGVKTYSMKPGDTFGVMIIPSGTVQQAFNGETWGSLRPLFSMTMANPNEAFHVGQIADVFGNGHTFVMEDLRVDNVSDKDYNDIIFQIRGATGSAVHLDDVIDDNNDWRTTDMGKALIAYAKPYDNPIVESPALDVQPTVTPNCEVPNEVVKPPVDISPDITPITDTKGTHFNFPRAQQPLIGVIDTGFSANNPDIDYSHITLGRDYLAGDANPLLEVGEGNEHGTHVLGVIAATNDNGVGIDGINDDAPIWVSRATGSGEWANSLVEFVNYAKESEQPNAVINLSMDLTQINPDGSVTTRYEFTPQERAAIEYARQHDVLIVVAAGNDGGVMSVLGQASQEFDNIITVGSAHNFNPIIAPADGFERVDYSSYGYGLDIMADGGTSDRPILSTVGDGVGTMAGTSVAAAQVTGAASQVWAANPDLIYRQVIELLKITATDLSTPNWDSETGAGLLNIAAAVGLAQVTKPEAYTPESFLTPTTWGGEGKVTPIERAASEQFNGKYYDWVSYTVKSGDTLSDIAYQTMSNGTAPYYNFIAQHNGLANPNLIYVGQVIQIPKEVSTPPVSTPTPTPAPAPTPTPTPTPPPTSVTINGYTISGSFYPVFQNYRGTLGNPTSGVINYSNGVSYQLFQNGSIVSSQYGTFPLYGGIRKAYLNTGGLDGWLGAPKSGEIGQGNGVIIQYFANGYIIWNGSKATAYKTGSGTPSQPAPNPIPDQSIKLKNFRGWVMPDIGVALRNSPRKDDKSGLADPYGKWLNFDAWTYGDTVNGDSKWFRIAGTNYWVPSAYIYGNPEGLPGNATPNNSGSNSGNINSGGGGSNNGNNNPLIGISRPNDLEAYISLIEGAINSSNNQIERLNQELAEKSSDVDSAQRLIDQYNSEISSKEKEVKELEDKAAELSQHWWWFPDQWEADRLRKQASVVRGAISETKYLQSLAQEKQNNARAEADEIRKYLTREQQQLEQLRDELKKSQQELAIAKAEQEALERARLRINPQFQGNFTEEDKRLVNMAIENWQKIITKTPNGQELTRVFKLDPNGPNSNWGGSYGYSNSGDNINIYLKPSLFQQDPGFIVRLLMHEIGHTLEIGNGGNTVNGGIHRDIDENPYTKALMAYSSPPGTKEDNEQMYRELEKLGYKVNRFGIASNGTLYV